MGGEVVPFAGLVEAGMEWDRLYAFESSGAPSGMLRVTGAQRRELLRYKAAVDAAGGVRVLAPGGERYPVESKALLGILQRELPQAGLLRLTRANTPQTDVRPLSLISLATIAQLSAEAEQVLDPRRFRANVYLEMQEGAFSEDGLVGRTLGLGATATVLIRERDPRCRFITYDPDEPHRAEPLFGLMKILDRGHEGRAGIYASVVTPGPIAAGDEVVVV